MGTSDSGPRLTLPSGAVGGQAERTKGAAERATLLIVPRFNLAEMITVIEPMRVANYLSPVPLYAWDIVSFDGKDIPASNGFTVSAATPDDRLRRGEMVFVFASWGGEDYANRETTGWIRRQAREGARILAVELGCYLAARAGLLTGRQVATHWSWAPGFRERYPTIEVVEQLYTLDDHVMTCAGGLAGTDMMIALIAARHGEAFAAEVADQILMQPPRPADAPQRRMMREGLDGLPPVVRRAVGLIEGRVDDPLGVPDLARALGLSQRQLERQFKAAVGCTVVQFGLLLRLQHARVLLTATKLPVRNIAAASGFNTLSHFTHSFRRCFGRRPSDYRRSWPGDEPAPSWPGTLAVYLRAMERRTQGAKDGAA
jgi:AraC family carnitine catabolism transcriptional activator